MNFTRSLLAAGLAALALHAPASSAEVKGVIQETIDTGGYTYMRLKTTEGARWAAVTQTLLKKGAAVAVTGAIEMKNFLSPTLKRRFDRILFGALASSTAADPYAGNPHAASLHGGRPNKDYGPIKVAKASGLDARTVAEIYAQRKDLAGKTATVSGKIVKLTPDVMDRHWAHLRDGTGSAKDGSDDLTVTLKEPAKAGDVVTVRGTVVLDKNLGGMYQFPLVVEDAVLVR